MAVANGYNAERIESHAAAIRPWARHLLTSEIVCERCHRPRRVRSINFT